MIPELCVSRRIRSWRSPDGALIDHRDSPDAVETVAVDKNGFELFLCALAAVTKVNSCRVRQNVENKARLSCPGDTRNHHETSKRDRDVNVFQVVVLNSL